MTEKKIRIIPHGLNLVKFKKYRSDPGRFHKKLNINFVGRIVKEKGIIELVSVINELKKDFPFIRLNIIGEGSLKNQILQDNNVNLYGFLPNKEVLRMNKKANIFCLPSYTETFGYATLEAMACGLPVIISAGKNVEKIINRRDGLFVKVNYLNPVSIDIRALKKHLSLLISSKNEREKFAKRSLSVAKKYSLDNMILKTKKVYDEILSL